MKKLKDFASEQNSSRIRLSVQNAEKQTAAEIVPVIVGSSTSTEHVWPMLTLIFLIPTVALYLKLDLFQFHPLKPWMVLTGLALSFALIARVLSQSHRVQMWLTHEAQERREVERRAFLEFYNLKMDNTVGKNGILLFLSLKERRAVVLADQAVAEKLPASTWNDVIKRLVTVAHKDSLEGLIQAIDQCARIAGSHFPRNPSDKNELPDHLIIKD